MFKFLEKINWGWRITMVYLGFVAFILFMVYKTQEYDIELVTTDYYAKELKHQEQIDKANRANALEVPLKWNVAEQGVAITFPENLLPLGIKAQVLLYSPSNSKNDFSIEFVPDNKGEYLIPASKLNKGAYQLQIDWQAGDVSYYNEGTIRVN